MGKNVRLAAGNIPQLPLEKEIALGYLTSKGKLILHYSIRDFSPSRLLCF